MKKLQKIILGALMLSVLAVPALAPAISVYAAPEDEIRDGVEDIGGNSGGSLTGNIEVVVNILLFVVGVASVIMLVVGGLRYVLSGGDQNAVNGAKNTILYAIIGIVVALLAYAIVNFVLDAF